MIRKIRHRTAKAIRRAGKIFSRGPVTVVPKTVQSLPFDASHGSPPPKPTPEAKVVTEERLPLELCENIIDLCSPQSTHRAQETEIAIAYKTLCACSLVCTSWLPRSRRNLYHTIAFLFDKPSHLLSQTLQSNPSLKSHIRSVCLFRQNTDIHLYRLTSVLIGCRSDSSLELTLDGEVMGKEIHPLVFRSLREMRCIQTLWLARVQFPSFSHFTQLISSLPFLTTISIRDVEFKDGPAPDFVALQKRSNFELIERMHWGPLRMDNWKCVLGRCGPSLRTLSVQLIRNDLRDNSDSVEGKYLLASFPYLHRNLYPRALGLDLSLFPDLVTLIFYNVTYRVLGMLLPSVTPTLQHIAVYIEELCNYWTKRTEMALAFVDEMIANSRFVALESIVLWKGWRHISPLPFGYEIYCGTQCREDGIWYRATAISRDPPRGPFENLFRNDWFEELERAVPGLKLTERTTW